MVEIFQPAGQDIDNFVTDVTGTLPITSSGGLTPNISTSMSTNKLIGRGSAGTGVMEEITLGTNLSLSGTTLNASGGTVSPLTTKGDVWGYSTTNARIPVGTDGQVLTADSAQTLGVKWSTVTVPTGANPTASVGLTAVNGSASTFMRSDGAPALSQSIAPTWTGQHTFNTYAPIFGTMTAGSVFFAGTSGVLSQDNSNFFYDATNHRLGLGTTTPNQQLEITKNFRLPNSTSTAGIIYSAGDTFIHNYNSTTNFFAGSLAGNLTLTSSYGVAIGYKAGTAITTGNGLVAIGYQAAYKNTSGDYSVYVGYNAGSAITSARGNVAIGPNSLAGTTTGGSNIAIGNSAHFQGNANENIAIGDSSMFSMTGGGYQNVGVGNYTLYSATSGIRNMAVGRTALYQVTDGSRNVGIGYNAGQGIVHGNDNMAIGTDALHSAAGSNNTAIGTNTLYSCTGSNNLAIGYQTAYNLSSGGNNIIIGNGLDVASNTGSYQMTIGNIIFGTTVDGTGTTVSTGKVGIKTASPGYDFDVNGTTNATAYRVGGTAGASGTFTTADLKTVTVTNGIITSIV